MRCLLLKENVPVDARAGIPPSSRWMVVKEGCKKDNNKVAEVKSRIKETTIITPSEAVNMGNGPRAAVVPL